MLMMLFDTGLRISEIIDMKPSRIRQGYFVVYGKGRKERVVPQNPIVSKWLMKYDRARDCYFQYSIQVLVEKLSVNTTIDDDAAGCLEFLVQLPDQLIGIGV